MPDDARAYFAASIPDADALAAGAAVDSASVLDDVLTVASRSISPVLAGQVHGYGPLRMRYFLDLATELAAKVDVLDTSRVGAAGAGAAKTSTLRGSRDLRRRAIRVLKSLAGRRPEEKERLKKARTGAETPDERARSLETLGKELQEAMSKVPASVAQDAGATPELVTALMTSAGAVLTTRAAAHGARGTVASLYDEMNLLDGRLLHELRLLVGAMTDARKTDKGIPAVKSALIKSGKRKKASEKKPDEKKPAEPPKDGPIGPGASGSTGANG